MRPTSPQPDGPGDGHEGTWGQRCGTWQHPTHCPTVRRHPPQPRGLMLLGVSGSEIIPSPRGDPALSSLLGVGQTDPPWLWLAGGYGLLAFILTPNPQQMGLMESVPQTQLHPHCPEAEEPPPPPPPLAQHRYPALSSGLAPAPAVCHRDRFRHAPGGILIPAYPPGCSRGLPARISPLSGGKTERKTRENKTWGERRGLCPSSPARGRLQGLSRCKEWG